MAKHIYPNERRFYQEAERLGPWAVYPVVEELKPLAKERGLWNLFLPAHEGGRQRVALAGIRSLWLAIGPPVRTQSRTSVGVLGLLPLLPARIVASGHAAILAAGGEC